MEPGVAQRAVENVLRFWLFGIHAGVRAYRLRHDRLPQTISDLSLPASLTTDPFTAKPLFYAPDANGRDYVLASAGALLSSAGGKPDKRTRFVFPAK